MEDSNELCDPISLEIDMFGENMHIFSPEDDKEEILKEQKILDKLIKKKEELKKLKETKFISEKKQIEKIEKKILELISEKTNIEKVFQKGQI